MRSILPYVALILGILGLASMIYTLYNPKFCYVTIALLCIAVILYIICMFKECRLKKDDID